MAEYSCKWNSHATNMLSVMDNLKGVENFVDVTLVSEGRSLKAHKLVLSTSSQFFHSMFLANPCPHPIVVMADIKFSILKTIVDYIYKGEVRFLEGELEPLLKAAKVLEIKGLMDISKEKLVSQQQTHSEGEAQQQQGVVFRSPRRKRPRPPSGEAHQFDDPSKEGEVMAMELVSSGGGDSNSENGEQDDDGHAKPQGEEANKRIKQTANLIRSTYYQHYQKTGAGSKDESSSRSRRSRLWEFFTPINSAFARCNTCQKKMSYRTSISNLRVHMSSKHPFLDMNRTKQITWPPSRLEPKIIIKTEAHTYLVRKPDKESLLSGQSETKNPDSGPDPVIQKIVALPTCIEEKS